MMIHRTCKKTPGVVNRHSQRSKIADRTLSRLSSQLEEGDDVDRLAAKRKLLLDAEGRARSQAMKNPFLLFLINGVSAFYVFVVYLISIESIVGVLLSVSATILTYFLSAENGSWEGSMDWVLLSFAVVTPMSVSIGISFKRREQALKDIAIFRSCAYQLYLSHACWDWGTADPGGRALSMGEDEQNNASDFWLSHADEAFAELVGIADELSRFLTLPNYSRARHRVTRAGRREAGFTVDVAYRLFDSLLTTRMAKFTTLTEVLKRYGLPPNEASRIRQWERMMGEAIEDLRMLKTYRTPQALRSFARLFTVFLPAFYAPTYAQLSRDINSLGVGVAFAVITSLALTALFESIYILEDPFVAHLTLDGIDVHEELDVLHWHQLMNARSIFFPAAPRYEDGKKGDSSMHEADNMDNTEGASNDRVMSRTSSYARFRSIDGVHNANETQE